MELLRFKQLTLAIVIFSVCKAGAQDSTIPYKQRLESYMKARAVYAQPFKTNPAYRIGDQLPDFGILKLINSSKSNVRLSDYKDRLLILDFWGTNCGTCIEALPHMEALQKQFGDKIKIQPVTPEREEYVSEWWKKNKRTSPLSISSVVEGLDLRSYFENSSVPHEIWVYKGKVIGITNSEYVDAYNIEQVLSGNIPGWPVKNDFYGYDAAKPLFNPDPKQIDTGKTFIKYAAIADYKETDNTSWGKNLYGTIKDPKHKTIRSYLVNSSVHAAYGIQWFKLMDFSKLMKPVSRPMDKTIEWEVTDRSKYLYTGKYDKITGYEGDWMRKNTFCFESLNPDTGQTDQMIAKSVISDLNRLLGLNVRWEKRKEKVLVLTRTTKEDRLKSKTAVLHADKYHNAPERETRTGTLSKFRGYSLGNLVWELNQQENNPYVYDETNYTGAVDMDLNFSSWTDIAGLGKSLARYGLNLKEEERLVDRFVITEINGGLMIDGQMLADAKVKRSVQAGMKDPSAEENTGFLEANKEKPGIVVLPSGLQYKVIRQGTGIKPKAGEKVKINYTGTLVNGKIFDSSYETGKPAEVRINENVISGWAEALPLMPVGAKWVLYIPASLAYGEHTGHGRFPPNSNLVFELELLGVIK